MVSVVSICNLALSNLGKDTINALPEATAEARACNQFYEHTRDTLLQSHPWRFAGKTQALALLTNDKPGAWLYAYKRPSDCLKVRWVRPRYMVGGSQSPQQEWMNAHEIEGETIYCNIETAHLRYTTLLTDPTKYPPLFVEALAWALTVRLAMPMTRDVKMRNDAFKLAQLSRGEAETADANEVRETSDHDSELVEVRG